MAFSLPHYGPHYWDLFKVMWHAVTKISVWMPSIWRSSVDVCAFPLEPRGIMLLAACSTCLQIWFRKSVWHLNFEYLNIHNIHIPSDTICGSKMLQVLSEKGLPQNPYPSHTAWKEGMIGGFNVLNYVAMFTESSCWRLCVSIIILEHGNMIYIYIDYVQSILTKMPLHYICWTTRASSLQRPLNFYNFYA